MFALTGAFRAAAGQGVSDEKERGDCEPHVIRRNPTLQRCTKLTQKHDGWKGRGRVLDHDHARNRYQFSVDTAFPDEGLKRPSAGRDMRYKSFKIENFKGIKNTTVNLQSVAGANVFAFVGLNESGKTTILEAIHSFSPDDATSELLGGEAGVGVPVKDRVPRHAISDFTGDVSVTAVISVTNEDKELIAKRLFSLHKLNLDLATFPDEIIFQRQQRFESGDYKASYFTLRTKLKIKGPKQRNWRDPKGDETIQVRECVYAWTPDIAYFPTFVFDFPETVFLTNRGGVVDKFYRRTFQDILDFDGRGHTIEKDILRRLRAKNMIVPWLSFLSIWGSNDDKEKIQHVMDRAGAAVTKLVFGRWNKIFGEDTRGKEVVITFDPFEGEVQDALGTKSKTLEHDLLVRFQIRDGTRRFNVNDRSLGFRWFFSFMLFTQFRVARTRLGSRPLLFLFDEPASNLHAAAQQKLIESFPEIAKGEHTLAYSTHSHYLIEPKWLEQTFIVTNRADAPISSVLDDISLDDESLDVKVETYRNFVNFHPGQTSYFQPILDRLDVVPSKFDAGRASIVLEGKSDYYILRYLIKLLDLGEIPLLPGLGAGTFGALAALHVGWNLKFLFVLDGDGAGKSERDRYAEEFGIPMARLATIDELVPGVNVIEDLLDEEARQIIQGELSLSKAPTKGQIRRFFQERLASDKVAPLGMAFIEKGGQLVAKLKGRLEAE
jgi:ABC-type Na+ transport system ATPase subunit NatA